MDYSAIGKHIRAERKRLGLSQEELAEMVNISAVHMSHIETGNTKLSLSVFMDIASALEVQADALLYDQPRDSISTAANEIGDVLENCSAAQARILAEVVKTAKQAMDAYL